MPLSLGVIAKLAMQKAAVRDRTCYVSGPMRGYDEYNFPAFDAARRWLERNGWLVYSPADLDREDGFDEKHDTGYDFDVAEALRRDFTVICRSGAIVLLPGWEKSEGANHELRVAKAIGLRVFELLFDSGDPPLPYWMDELGEDGLPTSIKPPDHPDTIAILRENGEVQHVTPESVIELGPDEAAPVHLPSTAAARKGFPVATGVIDYFPDALVAVAEVSRVGNDQHNPGSPLHWDRSKSGDEADALVRHLLDRGKLDSDGLRHSAKVAWRALALLQKEIESEASILGT